MHPPYYPLFLLTNKVLDGMELVHRIENLPTDDKDRPTEAVVIADCGELPSKQA